MPAAIVAVGAAAAGSVAVSLAVGAGLVVAGGVGAAIIGYAASTVVAGVLTDALTPDAPTAQQSARGVQVNTESQSAPLYTVYGETRVGGTMQVVGTSGDNNEYLHLIVAHAEGEVDSASVLYLGDLPHTDPKYAGLVHWEFFTGSDNQPACATLAGVNGWDNTHQLRGVCYSYVRLQYNAEAFNGIPQITVKLKGRKVFDPRTGNTVWSNNPALCLRDYLTNARFGRGIPTDQLDDASFIAAANACDSTYTDTSGNTRKLHTLNGVTNPDSTTLDNVRAMLTTCRGRLVYSARGYSLLIDKARATTFAFSPDNIIGEWKITLPGKRTLKNKIVGAWVNPDDLYKEDLYPADSAAFRATDGGIVLESRIELPFTQSVHEAQMLCERELRQSRFGIQASFRALMSAVSCEVGDVVTITHDTPGWVNKTFDVTRITLLGDDEVMVDCREYDPVIYSPHTLTAPRTTYTTLLPDPNAVPAFAGLALNSGTAVLQLMPDGTVISRIKAAWPTPTHIYLDAGRVELQAKPATDTDWSSFYHAATTGQGYIVPVKDGIVYEVRARWINEFGKRGAWQSLSHTVIGKTAPPSNVTGFTATPSHDRIILAWASITDVDLDEYEIREGNDWSTAILIGRTKSTTIKVVANFSGGKTWLIKAIDTSGNYSANASSAVVSIVPPAATTITVQVIDNNVLLSWMATTGTLPVSTYELRRGVDYNTAAVLGTKDGLFTVLFETASGEYRYWVTPIDTAGNYGTPAYAVANVNQPPDYILYSDQQSVFGGTKTNATLVDGSLYLPVNATETWQTHFTVNGWASPQDQINAGYPIYAQPTLATGSYTEVVDYGAILPGFKASIQYDAIAVSPGVTITSKLYSSFDGSTWSSPITGTEAYFSNFRYLKIELSASNAAVGTGLVEIKSLRTRLDAKRKTWGGKIYCNAADLGGTTAYLTDDGTSGGDKVFIDVMSLTPGATGASAQYAVFDFVDTPNPLSFKALLFNSAGTRISGDVYYSAIGV